jgi:hypothetical protein
MKVHLRFDSTDAQHTRMTLFTNGASCGQLTMSNAEAIWFHHILSKGCDGLSPKGSKPIEFVSSGHAPDPSHEAIDAVVQNDLPDAPAEKKGRKQ